ncbi:MAG TPA: threonine--tRNA ligase [Candidatus Saccharimonadales bacterium]|nr:threonine--tRNA ligase [Candidatus Saccharimonadales bacterium]
MGKVIEKLKNDPLMPIRHTAEHVLHMAMQELHPQLKKVMGPPIEEGFYFDFDLDEKISVEDFDKIEKLMQEIIDADLPVKRLESSEKESKELFKNNPYKLATIEEIISRREPITLYEVGESGGKHYDKDLCAGPHAESTGKVKAFKLLSVAGAYYKGSEKNKMLQRIYGTAFDSKEKLDEYLNMLEEAKKRDHKKLGPLLEIFMFHETAPGMAYWLPKGVKMYQELVKFWQDEHEKRGYQEIVSPLINKKELYETSGHWDHYKEDMFIADMGDNEVYCLKPMNCPNAMVVFGSRTRSYKELPLRLGDTDCLHRYERSGTLNGLLRAREFRQDDAHIFVTEEQIKNEFQNVFEITERFYSIFGLKYRFRLGTRPEKYIGDVETWNKAEAELKQVLEGSGKEYFIEEGDGAFYGPKIDILMKDSLGRDWQMGTIQLDFQMPKRFKLEYSDANGRIKIPVVIHRVIYGSLERFIAIIVEHFAGAFPVWLSPVQVKLVPIGQKHIEYAQKLAQQLKDANLRVEIDDRAETMQAKIRDAQVQKIPYMFIMGDREVENNQVSIRLRTGESHNALGVDEAIAKISDIYLTKSLNLW